MIYSNKQITKELISWRGCANWSAPLLFANPEDRFFCVGAHLKGHIILDYVEIHHVYLH